MVKEKSRLESLEVILNDLVASGDYEKQKKYAKYIEKEIEKEKKKHGTEKYDEELLRSIREERLRKVLEHVDGRRSVEERGLEEEEEEQEEEKAWKRKLKEAGLEKSDGVISEKLLGKDYEVDEKEAEKEYSDIADKFHKGIPEIEDMFNNMMEDESLHKRNILDIECLVRRINREFGEEVIHSIDDLIVIYKEDEDLFDKIYESCKNRQLEE